MIVDGYTMDIYCDNKMAHPRDGDGEDSVFGVNKTMCLSVLKHRGWNVDGKFTLCPICKKRLSRSEKMKLKKDKLAVNP